MSRRVLVGFVLISAAMLVGSRAAGQRPESAPVSLSQLEPTPTPNTAPIVRWLWNFGDPSTGKLNLSTEQHPSHRFSHAKTYAVTLTVWDANGNSDSITRYVKVVK